MLLRFLLIFHIIFFVECSSLASQKTPIQVLQDEQQDPQSRLGLRMIPLDVNNEMTKFVSPMEYRGPPNPDNVTFDYGPLKFELQPDTRDDRLLKITYDDKKEYLKGGKYYRENSLQLMDLLFMYKDGHLIFQCFYQVDLNVSNGRRVHLTFSALLPSNVDFSTARLISHNVAETYMFKLKDGNVLMDPKSLDADTIQVVPADSQTVVAFSPKRTSSAATRSSPAENASIMGGQRSASPVQKE